MPTMSVSSSAGRPRSYQGGTRHPHQQHQVRTRHHRGPLRSDYHTEHDTDRASSPRIGQRSQSLSALQPATTVIQPRMAQLETLEAKMASIEVSLSSATPRRKKCGGLVVSSPSTGPRVLNGTPTPHLDQLEGLRNALRDKENIIRSLRGQVTNPPVQTGLRSLINGLHNPKDRDLLTDQEKRHLEDRVQRLKLDTENKRLAIKNLKLALDKLDITDNIDVRIQQAELEYQLGREELNLLTLLEDARAVQARLDENAAATVASKSRNKAGSVHGCVTELGGKAQLLAVEAKWDVNSPRFGAGPKDSGGLWVDWAVEDTGLKKGDRLIEVNGKLVVNRCATREDLLRLLSAAPDPAQLVVLRGCTTTCEDELQQPQLNGGGHGEVSALRSELGLVRERAEEAQRAKDGLRADNLRLTHRISYLEEQVSELLETRRHRHHNNHHHHGHHEHQRKAPDQHVRTVTAVNNSQNITNINIGPAEVQQVFQKGPQVTALVAGTARSQTTARTPSNPCIAASDRYTTDEEQTQDTRRSTDIDEMRPSRRRTDVRSVKSLDLDSEPYTSSTNNHYGKPRKSLDYTSEPVANTTTRKRPTPPKKPIRLSLHRAQSLQSVENGLSTPISTTPSSEVPPSGRKRTHRGERSAVSGLRWPQSSSVAVHLHQRQTTRWC